METTKHEYLRAGVASGSPVGVDEDRRVIKGYVVAQAGPFKTGRGTFNRESLSAIVGLINSQPEGVVVNYGHHENVGSPEALDAFLGRAKDAVLDGDKVRADLHFNPVAFMSHNGGVSRGERLMERAKTDPASFASSIVVHSDKRRVHGGGPPLWIPLAVLSSDMVYIGDAVHGGILSASLSTDDDELARLRWRNLRRKLSADMPMMDSPAVGTRVQVKAGSEHEKGHAGMSGTIREVGTHALGIEFDDMPGDVHHWYVAKELSIDTQMKMT